MRVFSFYVEGVFFFCVESSADFVLNMCRTRKEIKFGYICEETKTEDILQTVKHSGRTNVCVRMKNLVVRITLVLK